jgi:DNA modification methylase
MGERGGAGYEVERTTVWSFPDRGGWAGHAGDFPGNWSPHVPRNLMLRYTREGATVLDPMCGGGTTLVEARLLGRDAIGFDINSEAVRTSAARLAAVPVVSGTTQCVRLGDARQLVGIASHTIDLVTLHPPYWNIIPYSNGIDGDLSRMNHADFLTSIQTVAREAHRVLRPDGHCAVLMGDTRKRKHVVPLSFEVMQRFLATGLILREHVIKLQHNTRSASGWPGRYDFLLLAHENLFVFRKPGPNERVEASLSPQPPQDPR